MSLLPAHVELCYCPREEEEGAGGGGGSKYANIV